MNKMNNFQKSTFNSQFKNRTILVVDNDRMILRNNKIKLKHIGYNVLTAATVAQAKEQLASMAPDAIVLDIMLPDGTGLDLLSELREAGSEIPVLLLTARNKSSDVARGLRLGANDYLSKPFEYDELFARIETMFRNLDLIPETIVKGQLTLKPMPMIAMINGDDMLLAQKEFALLLLFIKYETRIMSPEYLYEQIWGRPMSENSRALENAVSRLRKKLKGSGYTITTEYGNGYHFERGEP